MRTGQRDAGYLNISGSSFETQEPPPAKWNFSLKDLINCIKNGLSFIFSKIKYLIQYLWRGKSCEIILNNVDIEAKKNLLAYLASQNVQVRDKGVKDGMRVMTVRATPNMTKADIFRDITVFIENEQLKSRRKQMREESHGSSMKKQIVSIVRAANVVSASTIDQAVSVQVPERSCKSEVLISDYPVGAGGRLQLLAIPERKLKLSEIKLRITKRKSSLKDLTPENPVRIPSKCVLKSPKGSLLKDVVIDKKESTAEHAASTSICRNKRISKSENWCSLSSTFLSNKQALTMDVLKMAEESTNLIDREPITDSTDKSTFHGVSGFEHSKLRSFSELETTSSSDSSISSILQLKSRKMRKTTGKTVKQVKNNKGIKNLSCGLKKRDNWKREDCLDSEWMAKKMQDDGVNQEEETNTEKRIEVRRNAQMDSQKNQQKKIEEQCLYDIWRHSQNAGKREEANFKTDHTKSICSGTISKKSGKKVDLSLKTDRQENAHCKSPAKKASNRTVKISICDMKDDVSSRQSRKTDKRAEMIHTAGLKGNTIFRNDIEKTDTKEDTNFKLDRREKANSKKITKVKSIEDILPGLKLYFSSKERVYFNTKEAIKSVEGIGESVPQRSMIWDKKEPCVDSVPPKNHSSGERLQPKRKKKRKRLVGFFKKFGIKRKERSEAGQPDGKDRDELEGLSLQVRASTSSLSEERRGYKLAASSSSDVISRLPSSRPPSFFELPARHSYNTPIPSPPTTPNRPNKRRRQDINKFSTQAVSGS